MIKKIPRSVSAYMSEIGKKGGSVVSEKKLKALKKSAKLGGWPKGRPRKKTPEAIKHKSA